MYRSDSVSRFLPYLNRKAFQVLRRLLVDPGQLDEHIFEYVSEV